MSFEVNSKAILPASGSAAQASALPAASTTEPSSEPQVGKTYQAQVVRELQGEKQAEGVVIERKFYATNLPTQAKDGQVVTVKVLATEPELQVEFVNQQDQVLSESQRSVDPRLEQVRQQIAQVLKTVNQSRTAIELSKLPDQILRQLDESAILDKLINLDGSKGNSDLILKALQSLVTSQHSSNTGAGKQINDLYESIAKTAQNTEQLMALLEQFTSHDSISAQSAKRAVRPEQVTAGLVLQAKNVASQSGDLQNLIAKLEDSSPLALLVRAAQKLQVTLKDQPELPQVLRTPLKNLVGLFSDSNVSPSKEAITLGKAEVVNILKILQASDVPVDRVVARQLRIETLTLSAHINNIELQAESEHELKQVRQELLLELKQYSSSSSSSINPRLIEALKQVADSSAITSEYQRALSEYIKQQLHDTSSMGQLAARLQEIKTASSLDLIQSSLKALQAELGGNTSELALELVSFADRLLLGLQQSNNLPMLERSLVVQQLLQKSGDEILKFLEQLKLLGAPEHHEKIDVEPKLSKRLENLLALIRNTQLEFDHTLEGLFTDNEQEITGALTKLSGVLFKEIERLLVDLKGQTGKLATQITAELERFVGAWQQAQAEPEQFKLGLEKLVNNLERLLQASTERPATERAPAAGGMEQSKTIERLLSRIFAELNTLANSGVASTLISSSSASTDLSKLLAQLGVPAGNSQSSANTNNPTANPGLAALVKVLNSLTANLGQPNGAGRITQDFQSFLGLVRDLQQVSQDGSNGMEQALARIVQSFSGELEKASHESPKRQQEVLTRLANSIKTELNENFSSAVNSTKNDRLLKALNGLETMLRGQEAVQQLAPLLRAAGEPVFLLFPMLIQGFMSKLELVHYGPQNQNSTRTDGQGQQNKKGQQDQVKRTILNLQLPRLGKIQVDLKHTAERVECRFLMEDSQYNQYLTAQLPLLERALAKAGYSEVSCLAQSGNLNNSTEIQLKILKRPAIIA